LGLTWLDWIVLASVLIFAIRGFLRGTVAQVFVVLGVLGGLWAAGWVSQWVGQHWQGARPAVVYLILRWLVAALAGMAIAALFQWWGEQLGGAVKSGPLGFVDRIGGFAVGAALGLVVVCFVVMAGLLLRQPERLTAPVARMRLAAPLMGGAEQVCDLGGGAIPGGPWLKERFTAARRRVNGSPRPVGPDRTRIGRTAARL
jgi:uncharacterized membrane protein required for colicin V production